VATREEPHFDGFTSPFHCVYTASIGIEACAIGVGLNSIDITTRGPTRSVKSTVIEILRVGLTNTVDCAVSIGVEDKLVDIVLVYAFDDINLTELRPHFP